MSDSVLVSPGARRLSIVTVTMTRPPARELQVLRRRRGSGIGPSEACHGGRGGGPAGQAAATLNF